MVLWVLALVPKACGTLFVIPAAFWPAHYRFRVTRWLMNWISVHHAASSWGRRGRPMTDENVPTQVRETPGNPEANQWNCLS